MEEVRLIANNITSGAILSLEACPVSLQGPVDRPTVVPASDLRHTVFNGFTGISLVYTPNWQRKPGAFG